MTAHYAYLTVCRVVQANNTFGNVFFIKEDLKMKEHRELRIKVKEAQTATVMEAVSDEYEFFEHKETQLYTSRNGLLYMQQYGGNTDNIAHKIKFL